ncbi:MAG: indolepyruvate oxidoreductase subunit beta [Anaerolineales bacterium]|nr:indolepyruvate oxidoreductase subunit beta [Anaerolineales bacterium]
MSEKDKIWSIVFSGVGGQGVILITEITALAAVKNGYDVKQTEVHGVSQRGGSVETQVRFGKRVWSPMVTPGNADAVVGLEVLEGLRSAHYAEAETGVILLNEHKIVPASVENAEQMYPSNSAELLIQKGYQVIQLSATKIAHELGDGRMANVVMIGRLSTLLPIPQEIWSDTLKKRIPLKYLDPNLKAFEAGRAAVTA